MRLFLPLLFFLSAASLWLPGCKPREEELQTSGGLEFSADTVKFDTVFTTLRTITKRLWVYNRNSHAVNVDLVSLDRPAASPYTLLINGDLQQTAANLFIRGQDSLLILVRAKLPDNGQSTAAKDFVVQENLNFRTNGQDQHVLLRSFGQNIHLHDGEALPCNAEWTNDRPHVLYGAVVVGPGCTLKINPGTRIYAHAGAALIVEGTLLVNRDYAPGPGATDTVKAGNAHLVRFAGDRSGEAQYATAPGQWLGILFDAGSRHNLIRYALIQNATFGALLYNPEDNQPVRPDVTIQNSVIRYISGADASFAGIATLTANLKLIGGLPGAGILSLAGQATVENTLFSDCYEYAVLGYGGGDYSFNYCTIPNFPNTGGRSTPSLGFTNVSAIDTTRRNALSLKLLNSIVWGSSEDELVLAKYEQYKATVDIRNTLLRTKLYAAATDAPNKPGLGQASLNNVLNGDPKFVRLFTPAGNDYRPGAGSPALDRGAQQAAPLLPRDLLNLLRDPGHPDLGAYQTTK